MGIPGDLLIPGKMGTQVPTVAGKWGPWSPYYRENLGIWGPSEWESPVWLTIFPGV